MRFWLCCLIAVGCGRVDFTPLPVSASSLTLAYPRPAIAAVVNVTDVSLVPMLSAPAARFTIAPALPAGLALDPRSGAITGTPTETADGMYTVTAATAGAMATAALELVALPGYVVDSTDDAPDADAGSDATCAAASGRCTLRAAVQTTNHRATRELVLLDAATYSLGSQLDSIANDVVIAGQGADATVLQATPAHGAFPAFELGTAHALALRDLQVAEFGGSDGGALHVTAGTLDVDRCAFTQNASPMSGGVLFINGGAQATFAHSTFTDNASLGGNGGGWGGVIDGEDAGTAIVVTRSTAIGNATAWGSFSHITTGATLRLENSTLYGNTSTTAGTLATPGGIYTLVNDTIVGNTNTNTTPDSAAIYLFMAPCHYTIANTIVAFNTDATGAQHDCNRRDLTTTITSDGGNLIGDSGENCAAYFTAPGDRLATDPGVVAGPPGAHGGATATILLAPGSPALGAGQAASCPPVDQRDHPRSPGAACDTGAVQMP